MLWTLSTAVLLLALPLISADGAGQTKPMQIGMAKTFFNDRSKTVIAITADDFKAVLKKTTGLNGELISTYEAFEVAQKLNAKQLDFGIFHAHEFAGAQKKYPDLQPLMIAANNEHAERAYLIVHKNNPAKSIADLRGKKLDIPAGAKETCRLFVEKHCIDKTQKASAAFFGALEKSATQTKALDGVWREKVQATVVDTIGLEFYKEIKGPAFANNLRVLQQSEVFPPAVVAYKPGALDEATLNQFRTGLLKAHTTDLGRDMMKEWNIEAFEPIPQDYAKSLAEVLKAYPAPVSP